MPNLNNPRTLLICSVPVVIALLSVYWFKKKKKFKNLPCEIVEECEKVDSLAECSLDSADTLSDASSFASPESSEKSLRTKNFPYVNASVGNVVVKSVSYCYSSPGAPQSNHVEVSSIETSPSSIKSASPLLNDDPQTHSALNIKSADSDSDNNKSEIGSSAYEVDSLAEMAEKCNLLPSLAKLGDVARMELGASDKIEEESVEDLISALFKKPNYSSAGIEAIEEMLGLNQGTLHVVENGISHSTGDSNEDVVSPLASESKKSRAVDTESNDSHSSILDENSLSYVSDDSDRQPTDSKKRSSLLSDFNETLLNSLRDELDKCDSPMSSLKSHLVFASKGGDQATTEDASEFDANSNCVVADAINDINGVSPTQSLQADASAQGDTQQNFVLSKPNSSATESFNGILASCDRSAIKSNCVPSPVVKIPPKSSVSEDCAETFSADGPSPVSTSAGVSVEARRETSIDAKWVNGDISSIEKLVNGESSVRNSISAEDSGNFSVLAKAESEDPQIQEMDISEHLSMKAVSSPPGIETSSSESGWEMQDSQSDALSQGKSDEAGTAGSKVPENCSSSQYVYEFELPQELCGRLIGKHGKFVKSIKDRSRANVFIKRHPYDPLLKIVVVEGNRSDVNEALEIIRRKYPPSRYPAVTLVKTNMISSTALCPESLQLHIPEGASCDVILSSLVSAGHFFLQQPTHPTYPSLSSLDQCMIACYSQVDTPLLPHPVEAGVICAAPVMNGWYRAQVIYVYENEIDCELKFVDYGGFSQAPTSSLRQIRSDFMTLPFQASECYLANVRPVDPMEGWSAEATATFEELAQGQILQALLVDFAADGNPCVHLYRVQGISNMFINKELVERGLAVWVNNGHWDPH